MDTKSLLFLIFSAGYEAGYGNKLDLATAFIEWFEALDQSIDEMNRWVNYDELLKERHRLGLDEMSMISKVNAFNRFIDELYSVKFPKFEEQCTCNICVLNKTCEKTEHFENYHLDGCSDFKVNLKEIKLV